MNPRVGKWSILPWKLQISSFVQTISCALLFELPLQPAPIQTADTQNLRSSCISPSFRPTSHIYKHHTCKDIFIETHGMRYLLVYINMVDLPILGAFMTHVVFNFFIKIQFRLQQNYVLRLIMLWIPFTRGWDSFLLQLYREEKKEPRTNLGCRIKHVFQ